MSPMIDTQNKLSKSNEAPVFIWDVGGVILEWKPIQFAAKYENGKYQAECLAILTHENWIKLDRGDLSYQDMIAIYSRQLNLPDSEIHTLLQAVFHSLKPQNEVINLILQLKTAGYEQYCLTNGAREYLQHVTSPAYKSAYNFSLNDLFSHDQIVLSASINLLKPEPEIYHHILTKFNLKDRKIIFIDDTEKNIKGALAAGWWRGIHFTNFLDCSHAIHNSLIEFNRIPLKNTTINGDL